MNCSVPTQLRTKHARRERRSLGFTLLELLLVIAVGMILAAIAVPVIGNTLRVYAMRAATTSLSGAISSSRYQAIFHGCKSQVVFTAASYSYQALGSNITLTFSPGGSVISNPVASPITLTLTYPGFTTTVPTETITVSNYGNVTVAP
jgi:type II secretory pathway pseudopilin PulG